MFFVGFPIRTLLTKMENLYTNHQLFNYLRENCGVSNARYHMTRVAPSVSSEGGGGRNEVGTNYNY